MSFLRFLALAIRRTPIGAFLSAVSSSSGLGMTGIRQLVETPPWPMAEWWLPVILVLAGTFGFAWVFYRQVKWMNRAGPSADMPACRAIDYVVNYSAADVPLSRLGEVGREHEWARNELLARARAGDITVWGRRSGSLHPTHFENSLSKIDTEFWQQCEFSIAVYGSTSSSRQTQVRGAINQPHYRVH